jgi:hypothetical protein
MSDEYPYRTFEEFVDAFEAVRKQVRAMKRLFGFLVAAIIVGFAGLFYFTLEFPRQETVLDSRTRSLEKQGEQMQSSIKQVGAALQARLTGLSEKIEKVEQDVALLRRAPGGTGGDAAGIQDNANQNTREQKSNDATMTLQGSTTAPQASDINNQPLSPPIPLPRPRKVAQVPAAPRPAASAPASAGPVELKVGNQITPGQFALQPIPDELENKMPRLKGKVFFRYADRIFVVDPKDNRILELLQ